MGLRDGMRKPVRASALLLFIPFFYAGLVAAILK
jgi:hypothetical protein